MGPSYVSDQSVKSPLFLDLDSMDDVEALFLDLSPSVVPFLDLDPSLFFEPVLVLDLGIASF